MIIFSTLFLSMFITIALIPILRTNASTLNCVDAPCERKIHDISVPRVGGLAMAFGFFIPICLWNIGDPVGRAILMGAGVIVLFGFLDDIKDLNYRVKFCAQILAAGIFIFFSGLKINDLGMLFPDGFILPNWLSLPLTFVVIVGVTNAINLADGLDGLAGGMMLLCHICIGFLAYRCGYVGTALMAMATCGAIFGFLRFNTHPATVFMGDAGSQLLGFLTVTMSLQLSQGNNPISPLFPLLLLGLPVLDTFSVMSERIVRRRSPFAADKNHMHHKLLKMGFFHSEAVFIIYLLQAGIVTTAFFLRFQSDWLLLTVYLAFCVSVLGFFKIAEQKAWHLKRPGRFDLNVKHRLKFHIKDRRLLIRASQFIMEKGFILCLLLTCLSPKYLPTYLERIITFFFLLTVLILWVRPDWTTNLLRFIVYLCLPWLVYYGELRPEPWISGQFELTYLLSFSILTFFTIMTLKTTRRNGGFKTTPLDFIILFVAVILPNLPDTAVLDFNIHFLAAKIIILFFVFEVLVGELRGEARWLGKAFTAISGVLVVKLNIF